MRQDALPAQNLHRVLRAAYEREEYMARALEMINNTCPFDASGHPAMSIPCGMIDGLPIGMMIIGRKFDESTVLRMSDAFETAFDWKQL